MKVDINLYRLSKTKALFLKFLLTNVTLIMLKIGVTLEKIHTNANSNGYRAEPQSRGHLTFMTGCQKLLLYRVA